ACVAMPVDDAGVDAPNGGLPDNDGGPDGGTSKGSGCGCTSTHSGGPLALFGGLGVLAIAVRRRRR
ncbi:MAG: hypothetical protein H0T46_16790, partial [Deltaproteobacteria bacterium]|nr:hypothetical protein [Deltaproteobacteria bacterium]